MVYVGRSMSVAVTLVFAVTFETVQVSGASAVSVISETFVPFTVHCCTISSLFSGVTVKVTSVPEDTQPSETVLPFAVMAMLPGLPSTAAVTFIICLKVTATSLFPVTFSV